MKNLSWIAALLGVFVLTAYGLALSFIGQDAKIGMDAASEVAVGLPGWVHPLGAAGALLLLAGVAGGWSQLKALGDDQTTGKLTTAAFAVALVFSVGIVLNIIAQRKDERWDLTATKRFTLAQQSIDIARALDREVQVVAFFPTGSPEEQNFRTLLENYQRESTLIKAEFHDPYDSPVLAEQYKITSTGGTVVVKVDQAEQRLEFDTSEQAFTNALLKATSGKTHTVCTVTGHGESEALDDQSPEGLGVAMGRLQGANYTQKSVNLLTDTVTPETCEVVILAGPRTELAPTERDRLAQYVTGGGGLLAMLEPMATPETAADFARYGIGVGKDVVIEADPNRQVQGGDPTFVLLDTTSVDAHPITAKLQGIMLMRTARSVAKADVAVEGVDVLPLLHASAASWGETTIVDGQVQAAPDEGQDRIGNVPLAVAAEVKDPSSVRTVTKLAVAASADAPKVSLETGAPAAAPVAISAKPGGKVVVFGDSDFAGNQAVLAGTNQDLLLNTVAWMVGEDEQISVRSNEAGAGKLVVDVIGLFASGIVSLLVVPGLTIAGAIGTWLVRRRQ